MFAPLALSVLCAAPLSVRVWEKAHAAQATVAAKAVRCDGAPLGPTAQVAVGRRDVRVGEQECALVTAAGDVALTVGEQTRRFAGTLAISVEGTTLRFLTSVDVEDYLPSVVASEADGAPPAALEAQAVTSRTFALASRGRHEEAGYDLCDLTHCQLYRGKDAETKSARAAVAKTKGQALYVAGMVLRPAFFHAACGGHTSDTRDVYGGDGLGAGVSDATKAGPACGTAPDFRWSFVVDRVALAQSLGLKADGPAFEPLRRDAGGRVLELKSFGKRYTGAAFLSAVGAGLGYSQLKSLRVTATEADGAVHFDGQGFGHGVGLCQRGARERAAQGATAAQLLKHYFPGARVRVP